MKTTLKVEGFAAFDAALAELPDAVGKGVLRRTLKKAAEPTYLAAKAKAPARPADAPAKYFKRSGQQRLRRPGTLDALVQSTDKLTPRQRRTVRREGKAYVEWYVGTRDPVGRLIEYGTSDTAAVPFLRSAFEAHKAEALEIIRRELRIEIDKAAKRLAKKRAKAGA
jgi:HK97 gp10 family phage protein